MTIDDRINARQTRRVVTVTNMTMRILPHATPRVAAMAMRISVHYCRKVPGGTLMVLELAINTHT